MGEPMKEERDWRVWKEHYQTLLDEVVRLNRERRAMPDAVRKALEEMREIVNMYGELVPFDPAASGFDAALWRECQRKAVTLLMNRVLNGEWLAALEEAYK